MSEPDYTECDQCGGMDGEHFDACWARIYKAQRDRYRQALETSVRALAALALAGARGGHIRDLIDVRGYAAKAHDDARRALAEGDDPK